METKLWYRSPAKDWNEALPLGNGRLGAMVYGKPFQEDIQLNEESVWSGGFRERDNPDCLENLDKIRSLLSQGRIREAEALAVTAMTGTPEFERVYQTLGDLFLNMEDPGSPVENYRRELDLERAISTVRYTCGGVEYTREMYISAPAQVLVIRLTASEKGAVSFHARMHRGRFYDNSWTEGGCRTAFSGGQEQDGIAFCAMMQGSVTGGSMSTRGEYLIVEKADEAVIYVAACTSFAHGDYKQQCRDWLSAASQAGEPALRQAHLEDYSPYFARVRLDLGGDTPDIPTDERLEHCREGGRDQGLIALYFAFSRYLLISCSRPGTLPANLQGIWNNHIQPPWDSKYTININTEMNYWPAGSCGLSECQLPLFEHLKRMYPHGCNTAQVMYNSRGFVAHHNTDIWGDCAPQDTYIPATYWVMGAAWLCTHIWEHYTYTLDEAFLSEYYPLLKESCLFFVDYLVKNQKGQWVISPTVSPENTYVHPSGEKGRLCEGCAMDSQILTELFRDCIAASRVLQTDGGFAGQLETMLRDLPQPEISKERGTILEWLEDYPETEPGHRHISHLFALYPGHQISPEKTPGLAQAARRTLEERLSHGGGHTGWSRAWICNFWAALGDGEKAGENIDLLLEKSTLPNLFDNHPPFQIDGNFGAAAAIANMLVSGSLEEIHLLPALPPAWETGCISGLRTRGCLSLDIRWKANQLEHAMISAEKGFRGRISYQGKEKKINIPAGGMVEITPEYFQG